MRILMISTYPPMHCGIGTYAHQMVKWHRSQGDVVDILTPPEGNGDYIENLRGPLAMLKLLKYAPFYDLLIIQYHESFYYQEHRRSFARLFTHFSFILLFLFIRKIRVVVHELTVPIDVTATNWRGRLYLKLNWWLKRLKWCLAPSIYLHSRKELNDLQSKLKLRLNQYRVRIVPPNHYFVKYREVNKITARQELSLPRHGVIFLCIGFIQPHKGFDRALRAFAMQRNPWLYLYVVGSIRLVSNETIHYAELLRQLAADTPNSYFIERYVSDEEFDTWICAADVIVVPYREIWTSGVVGRAKLFGKPVIAAQAGALVEQLEPEDIIFSKDEELAMVFQEFGRLYRGTS